MGTARVAMGAHKLIFMGGGGQTGNKFSLTRLKALIDISLHTSPVKILLKYMIDYECRIKQ